MPSLSPQAFKNHKQRTSRLRQNKLVLVPVIEEEMAFAFADAAINLTASHGTMPSC